MASLLRALTTLGVMTLVGAQSAPATLLPSLSISAPDSLFLKPRDGITSKIPVEASPSPSVSDASSSDVLTDTPPNETDSVVPLAARLTGFDGCDDPQFIRDAFTEFEKMVPLSGHSADNEYVCVITSRSIANHRITAVTLLGMSNTRGRILPGPVVPPWTSLGL
jgi:hypothetical protein